MGALGWGRGCSNIFMEFCSLCEGSMTPPHPIFGGAGPDPPSLSPPGRLGERLALRRAGWLRAPGGFVATYAHGWVPPGPPVAMGTYGALVACGGPAPGPPSPELQELGRRVAQHVVGMAPTALGSPEDELGGDTETRLLAQGSLLEPGVSLGQYLRERGGLQVWDFLRFQCGEEPPQESPPEPCAPPA